MQRTRRASTVECGTDAGYFAQHADYGPDQIVFGRNQVQWCCPKIERTPASRRVKIWVKYKPTVSDSQRRRLQFEFAYNGKLLVLFGLPENRKQGMGDFAHRLSPWV